MSSPLREAQVLTSDPTGSDVPTVLSNIKQTDEGAIMSTTLPSVYGYYCL